MAIRVARRLRRDPGELQVTSKRQSLPLSRPYLRVANVHRGRLDLTEVKTIPVTQVEVDRTRLNVGDLLFVEGHANPQEVGRVAVWDGSVPDRVHQNHLIRVRLDRSVLLPEFAVRWFNSPAGASHFRRAGKTTSGLNTISASTVRSAPVQLPPSTSSAASPRSSITQTACEAAAAPQSGCLMSLFRRSTSICLVTQTRQSLTAACDSAKSQSCTEAGT